MLVPPPAVVTTGVVNEPEKMLWNPFVELLSKLAEPRLVPEEVFLIVAVNVTLLPTTAQVGTTVGTRSPRSRAMKPARRPS